MTTAKDALKMIKDNDVKYVDFRFTDPRGKWQHVTVDISTVDEDTFSEGIMFDGSSIAGWKAIHESDMQLMPDPESACIDPFYAETTMVLVCDTLEPLTGEPYNRDPRSIARKAEGLVKSMGICDSVFFGPEAEFFIFDDVRYSAQPYNTGFRLDSIEFPTNSDTEYEGGNLGHHVGFKKGYFPVPPQDTAQDIRSEMLGAMAKMGVAVENHHHEVGSAQHELGMKFAPMVTMADRLQIYKYCIHQVANIYGKTATFMPKPVYGDNGSAGCRIPLASSPKGKRVEVRYPDPLANPYLAFAAMLMAGLDGIRNKLDPGPAIDKDLYDLPPEELKQIPTVCGSLREALGYLDKDRAFLKAGGVFEDDFIDAYIELKMQEVIRFEHTPHPVEYEMYYSS